MMKLPVGLHKVVAIRRHIHCFKNHVVGETRCKCGPRGSYNNVADMQVLRAIQCLAVTPLLALFLIQAMVARGKTTKHHLHRGRAITANQLTSAHTDGKATYRTGKWWLSVCL